MLEDNSAVACTSNTSRINEFEFAQLQELTANQTTKSRPREESKVHRQEWNSEVSVVVTNDRTDDDGWNSDDEVCETHQDRIDFTSVETRDRAHDGSECSTDCADDEHDENRTLSTAHDQGQIVTANIVLPEWVLS